MRLRIPATPGVSSDGRTTLNEPQLIAAWRRSTQCDTSACVEATPLGDGVAMRNSADPERVLRFSRPDWSALIAGIRAGDFDF